MNLPQLQPNTVIPFFQQNELILAMINQIEKDFSMFGYTVDFSKDTEKTYHSIHKNLTETVNKLLSIDFPGLLSVLYQIDISDQELQKAELELVDYSYAQVIAHLIIVRELKKVIYRQHYK